MTHGGTAGTSLGGRGVAEHPGVMSMARASSYIKK
jgi:hypothetical protein